MHPIFLMGKKVFGQIKRFEVKKVCLGYILKHMAVLQGRVLI